jgi:hypothetical protein
MITQYVINARRYYQMQHSAGSRHFSLITSGACWDEEAGRFM